MRRCVQPLGVAMLRRALTIVAVFLILAAAPAHAKQKRPPEGLAKPRRSSGSGEKMVWGERRGHATFGVVEQSDGVPHALSLIHI